MIKTDIDDNALMVAFRGDDPAADEALGLLGESDRVFVSSFRCIDRRGYYLRSPPTPSSRLRASNCFRGGIAVSLANMLDATTEAALGAFRCRLEERFGPRLRGLVLFGSRARGDHHDESDADVAVFLRPVADPIAAQMDMATDAYAVFLATGIMIQPWAFGGSPEHPDRGRAAQLLDAVEAEGITL